MGHYTFKLPDIGEGIAESEIALWRVAVGDVISEDQPLVDMLTDKAAVEIPSPVGGRILHLHGEIGDKIAVGGELVTVDLGMAPAGSALAEVAPAEPVQPTPVEHPAGGRKPTPPSRLVAPAIEGQAPAAAPTVRRRARELGLDLACVCGSGPFGRILHADLDAHIKPPGSVPPSRSPDDEADRPAITAAADEATTTVKVIGLRRRIAQAMQRSKQRIPHFAYVEEVDMTELESLRRHLNEICRDRPKLTLLPFIIRALVRAIPSFPMVNATFDDDAGTVTRHRAVHVGIATQTPNGVMVPVLRHAQRQELWPLASGIKRLADVARAGRGTREELSGSTITITSLGALGGIATTPVINAPEVAILGINRMMERPVVKDGQIVIRTLMNVSSSFDHRIVDGFDAARFIQKVKGLLEHPATLFLQDGTCGPAQADLP